MQTHPYEISLVSEPPFQKSWIFKNSEVCTFDASRFLNTVAGISIIIFEIVI